MSRAFTISRALTAILALGLAAVPTQAQGNPSHSATYLGGGSRDEVLAVAVAANGDVIVAGKTISSDFPATAGVFDPQYGGRDDAFVARLSPDGSRILAATFLGDSGHDQAVFVHEAADGSIWVGGTTESAGFPTTPDGFASHVGSKDAFVVNLDANLTTLRYGTTFGNSDRDRGEAFAIDDTNQLVYLAGRTNSSFARIPVTTAAVQSTPRGGSDFYLAVLDLSQPGSTALAYGTLLGGSSSESDVGGLTLEANGVVTISGTTVSTDFPITPGAVLTTGSGGSNESGVVARIDTQANGSSALLYATYIGGSSREPRIRHTVDPAGVVHVLLDSSSPDLPLTPNAMISAPGPNGDAYYAQIDPSQAGSAGLRYGSRILTLNTEQARSIAWANDKVGLLIWTNGHGQPTTSGAFQSSAHGNFHGYFMELDVASQTGPTVIYATRYAGCSGTFDPQVMVYDGSEVVIAGKAAAGTLPVTLGVAQPQPAGSTEGFVSRLELRAWPAPFASFGSSCAGSTGTPQLVGTSAPQLCRRLVLTATGLIPNGLGLFIAGFDRTQYQGTPLPFSLAAMGAPGCEVLVGPEATLFRIVDGNGEAALSIALPGKPSLLGTVLFTQFALLDNAANPLGLVTSNGLSAEVRW